jgi:ArsR family transcriptional regulator
MERGEYDRTIFCRVSDVPEAHICSMLPTRLLLRRIDMIKELPIIVSEAKTPDFTPYENKFKALADQKRLQIMYELTQRGNTCVCDLVEILNMPQSKLSYHLKILLDAGLILRETKGTWSYYELNQEEVNNLLSPALCCMFRNADTTKSGCC